MTARTTLQVQQVSVTFGGVAALSGVSLNVGEGEVVAVIGPNGAGKSTLFNALTGMAPLARGQVLLGGAPLRRALRLRHIITALFVAACAGLFGLVLEVGPEALFVASCVRPYEVAYVAQAGDGSQAALADEPRWPERLMQVLRGDGTVGASWQGYMVWLPSGEQAGPVWHTLARARAHARALSQDSQHELKVAARMRRHVGAAAFAFVLGAGAFAQVFARSRRSPDHIARMGVARTFQNIRLFGALTVLDNVLVAQRRNPSGTADAMALLQRVGLTAEANRQAASLAYGDMRRLEIARALATRPKVLLLDEPAAGMNATETAGLQRLIRSLRDDGIAVLLIEHDMPLVMDVADRVVVLEYGRKIADGPPAAVQADPRVIAAYLGQPDEALGDVIGAGGQHAEA